MSHPRIRIQIRAGAFSRAILAVLIVLIPALDLGASDVAVADGGDCPVHANPVATSPSPAAGPDAAWQVLAVGPTSRLHLTTALSIFVPPRRALAR